MLLACSLRFVAIGMLLWGGALFAECEDEYAKNQDPEHQAEILQEELPHLDGEETPADGRSPVGKWLDNLAQYDPRPYDDGVLFDGAPGAGFFEWKRRQWVEDGWAFGGYVSANSQWGSVDSTSHSISETLLLATWEPVRHEASSGRLVMGLAHDLTFGHPTTRKFADAQGLVETPNDLDTDPDPTFTTLGLFHWEHEFRRGPRSGWGFRAGQLYGPSYFGVATYLNDDRSYFLARPLAAAGGAQWVGSNDVGLGVNVTAWSGPFYFSVAAIDGKANRKYPDFRSLTDGQLLYIGETGLEWDVGGADEAAVRLTVTYLDVHDGDGPDKGRGQSAIVSAYQQFDGRWALAGQWSRSFERLSSDYRELASGAVLWLESFSRSHDILGLGAFVGDPSDSSRGSESGGEIFYRLQVSQGTHLMPSLQYWSEDDADSGREAWVAGLRLNFEF